MTDQTLLDALAKAAFLGASKYEGAEKTWDNRTVGSMLDAKWYDVAASIIATGLATDLHTLRDSIIAGLRGDDQDAPNGSISTSFAEQIVREDFEQVGA